MANWKRSIVLVSLSLLGLLWSWRDARAWIFPEHRDIGQAAIRQLDEKSREKLNQIWHTATSSDSTRFCKLPSQSDDVVTQTPCADLPTLFAIGGDHSCSPEEMEKTVLESDWFPRLLTYIAELRVDFEKAKTLEKKLSIWNDSNVSLLRIDSQYLARAAGNNAHFPLHALPVSAHETLDEYLSRSTRTDAPVNAVEIYARYHLSALRYARLGLMNKAVMTEAFAIHFLEDLFAAGHYAGSWGESAARKGTHDYYSDHGLITQTWGGQRFSGHGDAFMSDDDVKQTSQAVNDSLQQLIQASAGDERSSDGGELNYFHQSVCRISNLPEGAPLTKDERALLEPILLQVPIPTEGETGISVPRFRTETGRFFSISSGLRFGAATGGLSETEEDVRAVNRLELLARIGLSTIGVLSNHSDGAIFLEFGYVLDSNQYDNPQLAVRDGQRFGMRMPYWLIPGDLLLIAPALYFSKNIDTLQNIAISASNGGLLGLQRKLETGLGSFQFMMGRQIAISIYGYLWSDAPRITSGDGTTIGHYRSVETDIPIIEYQAARAFAEKLAFSFTIQFGYALEIPSSVNFVSGLPGPTPTLSDSNTIYLRFSLEGIKY